MIILGAVMLFLGGFLLFVAVMKRDFGLGAMGATTALLAVGIFLRVRAAGYLLAVALAHRHRDASFRCNPSRGDRWPDAFPDRAGFGGDMEMLGLGTRASACEHDPKAEISARNTRSQSSSSDCPESTGLHLAPDGF